MKLFSSKQYRYLVALTIGIGISFPAFAQWAGGTGTSGDPYQIATIQQLTFLQTSTNANTNYTNVYFRLMSNLDLGGNAWTPIGNSSSPFRGNFDGDSHTISGLFINTSGNDVGLFGYMTNGSVSNLGVTTSSTGVKGNNNVGILLGSQNGGTITNCFVMGTVAGNDIIGGMVGNQASGTNSITQCFALVDATGSTNVNGVGGLIGVLRGTLNNSYAWGELRNINTVGGLVGTASSNGVINACYAMNNVQSSVSSKLGGLAGNLSQATTTIQNSVALNKTLVGYSNNVGRVAGLKHSSATLANNYASAGMSVTMNGQPKTIVSDNNNLDGGTQNDAVLKTQTFYNTTLSWSISSTNDATKIWNIWDNTNTPYLQTQSSPVNNISISGTTLQGIFRTDAAMDSISIYIKSGTSLIRLGTANVDNTSHTWTYTNSALLMNGVLYIIAYESGKDWPSYPTSYTICGIPPTFDVVSPVLCSPAINLQTCITNLQNANLNDVQFSKAGGAAFDANIIPSPANYFVKGTQTIYARATTSLGCQSVIKSFQVTQTGSLLFKEDFGSGINCSSTPLGSSITSYIFGGDLHTNGHYGICSELDSYYYGDYWYSGTSIYDHTNPGIGRSLIVNADFGPGQFYTLTINNLCPGTRLNFSAWVFNLVNPNAPNTSYYTNQGVVFNDPDLLFELTDADNGNVLAQYNTGSIPKVTDPAKNWRPYGFEFVVGSSSSVTLTLYNNAPGGNGNDLMIDDIEIYLCFPPVSITAPTGAETVVCSGDPMTLTGTYTDDGTLGNDITYRWIRSTTGNVNNPADWTTVFTGTSANPLNVSYTIPSMGVSDEGYYRLVVGTSGSIDLYNCIAKSAPIHLTFRPKVASSDINVTGTTALCAGTSTTLTANLQNTLIPNAVYKWYNSQTATEPLFMGQTYHTPDLTVSTTYYVGVSGNRYCENAPGDRYAVTVTVIPLPTADDILTITEPEICSGTTATLTATTSAGLIAHWYADAGLTNFLLEGNTYTTPVLNAGTTYYVIAKNTALGCMGDVTAAKPAVVTVNPRPEADFGYLLDDANPFIANFFDSTTVSTGSIVSWQWDFGDGTTSTLQNPVHLYALPEADHEVMLIATGNSGCSDTVNYSIHVGKTPYARFGLNDTAQCLGGNSFEFTNLSSISIGELPQTNYLWTFGDGAQSTLEHPVHHYTAAGTYTVKLVVDMSGLLDSTTLEITVYPMPEATDIISANIPYVCAGNTTTLSVATAPGFVPRWYGDAGLTDFLTEGSTYTTPVLDSTTTYYVAAKNTVTGCSAESSEAIPLIVVIYPLPTINDITTITSDTVCIGSTATLSATATPGFVPRWYADAALTDFLTEGFIYTTPALIATTTYYVAAKNIDGDCMGGTTIAKPVTATVALLPTFDDILDATGVFTCANSTATLSATAAQDFVPRWYGDAALTDFLAEGTTYTTPVLTASTTYYVVAKNILTGCIGDAAAANPVSATVIPLPTATDILDITDATICAGNTATISATAAPGFVPSWYSNATLNDFLIDGDTYTTPLLNTTTTYYVVAKNTTLGCIGSTADVIAVAVTVDPLPTADDIVDVTDTAICAGGTATLSVTAAPGFIPRWYADSALVNFLLEGDTYTSSILDSTTTYYVVAKNLASGCIGLPDAAITVTAVVNPLPIITDITNVTGDSICPGTTATVSAVAAVDFVPRWYADATLTDSLFEGSSYTTQVLDTSRTYYVVAKNAQTSCIGTMSAAHAVTVVVNPKPQADFDLYADDIDPFTIYFFDSTKINTGSIVAWNWDFGDGDISTFQNPQHQYTQLEADYTITLIVFSDHGCSDTVSYPVHVGKTLHAQFGMNDTTQCLDNNLFVFKDLSVVSIGQISQTTYLWTFGDGSAPSSLEGPEHHYDAAGTYEVKLVVTMGSLKDSSTMQVTVYPMPSLLSKQDATLCEGESVDLNTLIVVNANTTAVFYSAVNGAPLGNTVVGPPDTTQYYVLVSSAITLCETWDSLTVNVNALPGLLSKRDTTLCSGESIDLNSLVVREANTTLSFYTAVNGTLINPAVVTPVTTTEYYIKIENNATTCTAWDSLAVGVNPRPLLADILSVTGDTICSGNTATVSATALAEFIPQWYSDPALTDFLFEGSNYTTPVLNTTTTYYVVAKNIVTGCVGDEEAAQAVTVTVNPEPIITDIIGVTSDTICSGNTATVSATAAIGFIPQWYSDAALTNFLFEGGNYTTPVLNTTTTYYVVAKNRLTGCVGAEEAAQAVTVTVNPLPTITDITGVTDDTICSSSTATVSATTAADFIPQWYSDAALTNFLFEGNSYTTPVLTTTTTYYVVAKNRVTGCLGTESAVQTVTVTVNPLPTAGDIISITGNTTCEGSTATVSATTAADFIPQWYSDAALTTLLFEGNNYKTPVLNTTTTYYVVAKNIVTGCVGAANAAQAVTVTVNPLPIITDITGVTGDSICSGTTAAISATAAAGFIPQWYSDAALTTLLFEGNNYITPVLNTSTIYYVVAKNTTTACMGNADAAQAVQVIVNQQPGVNPVPDQVHCPGEQVEVYTFTGDTPGAQYAWRYLSGDLIQGLPQSGNNQMPAYLAVNNGITVLTAYYEVVPGDSFAGNTCSGIADTFAIQIQPLASVTLANRTQACSGDPEALLSCINNNPSLPVSYKITFSEEALAAGFVDMSDYVVLTGPVIHIALPAGVEPSLYEAYLSVHNDCSVTDSIYDFVIEVIRATSISQQPESQYLLCDENGFIHLEVKAEGTNLSYQWYQDGSAIQGATGSIYEKNNAGPSDYGIYTVEVRGSCGTLMSDQSHVKPNDVVIMVKWDDVLFVSRRDSLGNPLDIESFQWYRVDGNGQMSPIESKGQSQYYAELGLRGTFAVEVTYSNGEKQMSCPYTLIPIERGAIKIYPNPAASNEKISLFLDLPGGVVSGSVVEVFDMLGKLLQKKTITQAITEFYLYTPGSYMFRITEPDGNVTTKKVVVQ